MIRCERVKLLGKTVVPSSRVKGSIKIKWYCKLEQSQPEAEGCCNGGGEDCRLQLISWSPCRGMLRRRSVTAVTIIFIFHACAALVVFLWGRTRAAWGMHLQDALRVSWKSLKILVNILARKRRNCAKSIQIMCETGIRRQLAAYLKKK